MVRASGVPEWRDAEAYRFERLDRPGFAWEWLRRDLDYQLAARRMADRANGGEGACASAWGLAAFEDPALAAPAARPMWLAAVDRFVLRAEAVPAAASAAGASRTGAGDGPTFAGGRGREREPKAKPWNADAKPDALVRAHLGALASMRRGDGIEHLLLSDGCRGVRVDIVEGTLGTAPVRLNWQLSGIAELKPQLLALERFVAVVERGLFPKRLWPCDPRARRWTLALRACDALAQGASQREIAGSLIGGAEAGDSEKWRVERPSLRLQAQRLVALAGTLRGRGFARRYLGPHQS